MSPLLDPALALFVLVVFLVVVLSIWFAVGAVFYAYWRLKSPDALMCKVIHHYVKVEYLHQAAGIVTRQAQRRRHVLRMLSFARVSMAYFYVGRNGRGGRLNHAKPRTEYALVAIVGEDFIASTADHPIYMR